MARRFRRLGGEGAHKTREHSPPNATTRDISRQCPERESPSVLRKAEPELKTTPRAAAAAATVSTTPRAATAAATTVADLGDAHERARRRRARRVPRALAELLEVVVGLGRMNGDEGDDTCFRSATHGGYDVKTREPWLFLGTVLLASQLFDAVENEPTVQQRFSTCHSPARSRRCAPRRRASGAARPPAALAAATGTRR